MDISIIICTYNGADKIERTLQSIVDQKAVCSRELIVVDNASTDGTAEVVSAFFNKQQVGFLSCKLVYEAIPGLIHARLAGMKAAASDIMLYCDDDNTLCESYVQTGYEIMKANPLIGALGGCGIAEFESEKPDWFDIYYHSYAVGPQADKDGKIKKYPAEVYGAGSFFRKAPLQRFYELGFVSAFKGRTGKVLSAGDDVEWCFLLQMANYEIWYNSSLHFLHFMPRVRLFWKYYEKMKLGIASGAANYFPYAMFFSNKKLSFTSFYFIAIKRITFYIYLFIKSFIFSLLVHKNRKIHQFNAKLYLVKVNSFYREFLRLYKLYIRLITFSKKY